MNYESQENYEAEMGYAGQAEAEALAQLEEQHPIIEVDTNTLSKVNWEEKMTEPDMFVIKKTQGNGGYVCYNHGRLKYTQVFAHNPQDALQQYMEKIIELLPTN